MTSEPPIVSPPTDDQPSPIPSEPEAPRAWGFWLTLVFSICIFICYVVPQVAVAFVASVISGSIHNPHGVEASAMNGLVVSIGILLASPIAVGLCVLFAWLRQGFSVREYLALMRVSWKVYVAAIVGIVLFNIVFASLSIALDRPDFSDTMLEVYRTAKFPPILWAAMVLGAPVTEEVFFRGFVFKGIEQSWLGGVGAVLLSSVAWALIHVQYDLYDMGVIFAMGLLLGAFRLKTGSLVPALLMHILNNLVASIQVALLLADERGLSSLL